MSKVENFLNKENYRFCLCLNDELISERIFPADVYSMDVRSGVNLRDMPVDDPSSKDAPTEMIRNLQRILSIPSQKLNFIINGVDVLKYHKEWNESYNISGDDSQLCRKSQGFMDETGFYRNPDEQFKFILYLNDNHVIERNFLVKKFNPEARFSSQLSNYIEELVLSLQAYLTKKNISTMYEEFEIKGKFNMAIEAIRLLSKDERKRLLDKIHNN